LLPRQKNGDNMPIGIYKIPQEDAEILGYYEAYIMGEYEIKDDKIIIAKAVYPYVKENLIEVDPADFEDISKKPMKKGIELFKKYGVDVDFVLVTSARKGNQKKVLSLLGGKVQK
jgi:hypothetical protein